MEFGCFSLHSLYLACFLFFWDRVVITFDMAELLIWRKLVRWFVSYCAGLFIRLCVCS
ncbi:hypothetical protein F4824DRAFT_452015 [Ustulina deusta]|nr:hypothetical protein F4824DRAFT_452015 [Ustulina deusta]